MLRKPMGHAVEGEVLTDAEAEEWRRSFGDACCANCEFGSTGSLTWETDGDTMRVDWGYVVCKRYPPVLMVWDAEEQAAHYAQPETAPHEWCGEWESDGSTD